MARKDERAAGGAVEPMHDVDVGAHGVPYAKKCDVVVVVPTAMHQQPRRFVGDDDVFVDIEQLDPGRNGRLQRHSIHDRSIYERTS
jgi:hypothetical protein